MRLLLIRHAETPANVAGALSTEAPGPGITDLGRQQADALARSLADGRIDGVYASTLRRTVLTAEPVARAHGLEVQVVDGLQEIEAGDYEGSTGAEAFQAYIAPILAWRDGDLSAVIPGAHDGHHFLERFDGAIASIAARHAPGATVAVFSHAGAMQVWLGGRTANVDPAFSAGRRLENTGAVVLDGSPSDGWHVITWQGEPVGGPAVEDPAAVDPLGGGMDAR